jgi:hypothetical protein
LLALVILEAVAVGLLGLLVAGLLRSHAEILRQLHRLGAGREEDVPPPRPGGRGGAARGVTASGAPARGAPARGAPARLEGAAPDGEAISIALDRAGERSLLLFLSSGCGTCAPWWDALRAGAHRQQPWRTVVVARSADEESPSLVRGMAPPDVTVVLSNAAWDAFGVPGSPYAVMVEGGSGRVAGEGVARSWAQLAALAGASVGDLDADAALSAAGIGPGHPSLYPERRA